MTVRLKEIRVQHSEMKRCKFSGYNVPREFEEQILLKLPVKSLVRFRSVSKDWNSVITHQKFVKEHLQLQASKPSSSLLLGWARSYPIVVKNHYGSIVDLGERQALYLLTIGDSIKSTFVKEEIYLPIRPTLPGDGRGVLVSLYSYHCDGIVCLVDQSTYFEHQIAFYNPALREHELVKTLYGLPINYTYFCSGFGHDPKTDDYKFVRLLSPCFSPGVTKAEVYTLRTASWREIELDTCWSFAGYPGAYLKSRVYWQSYFGDEVVVWFDVSNESFGTLDLPRPRRKWTTVMPLLVWDGSLVFFNKVKSCFEMWVMDGEAGGWSEYYNMGELPDVKMPIAFWKEDELLMERRGGSIMSYNIRIKKLRNLPFPTPALPDTPHAALYTETLVSVKNT